MNIRNHCIKEQIMAGAEAIYDLLCHLNESHNPVQ